MQVLTSDFEVQTWSKGNPYDQRNKAVCLGIKYNSEKTFCLFDLHEQELGSYVGDDLMAFFNAKFDVSWYRKLGVEVGHWKIWCCQIAEFILEGQINRYPSLEDTAVKYSLGSKIDIIKKEYWDKGINTDEIPRETLSSYCCQDVDLTYAIYLKQLPQFEANPKLYKLFKLMCQDLLVLQEMEWNGIKYDGALCKERSVTIEKQISTIEKELDSIYPDLDINFNSPDQLSAFLYGGTIYEDAKEHIGFFKTGAKAGQPKYKNIVIEHKLPRLVEPLPKSQTKKEGVYKTDEATLKKLKGPAAKKFVGPLLDLSKLDKLNGTYYKGIPELAEEMNWPEGEIHGQFNQVVAATGRLSSNAPNLQNAAGEFQDVLISRY
jgi:DNA polymerase-1